jgi:hypothetical protein
LTVSEGCAIGKCDDTIVKPVSPENPVGKDVLIVERYGLWASTTHKTVIPLSYVRDESLEAEIYYATLAVDYGFIWCPKEHRRMAARLYFQGEASGKESREALFLTVLHKAAVRLRTEENRPAGGAGLTR